MKFPKVIIYQFGRVGSSSLKATFGGYSCKSVREFKENNEKFSECIHVHAHKIVKYILENSNEEIHIIMPVRFAIQRNISAFFHNLQRGTGSFRKLDISERKNINIQQLITNYENNYQQLNLTATFLDQWMKDASKTLSVNLLKNKFNMEKKYEKLKKNNARILLLRYEDISNWTDITSNFINTKINIQCRKNAPKPGSYSDKYIKFKNIYNIPNDEKEAIQKSVYINKFYTQEEINKYLSIKS